MVASVRRLLSSISATALARSRPWPSNWVASSPRPATTRPVTSLKLVIVDSTRAVASPVEAVTSFMELTKSDTRSISVFSSALMFSCAPESTSCSMMLASRSRSNSAVVSERSMLCVSIISLTVDVAVCLAPSIAFCAASCSSLKVRLTVLEAASPALLIMRAISPPLSSMQRVKAKPRSSIDWIACSVAAPRSWANCWPLTVKASSTPPLLCRTAPR